MRSICDVREEDDDDDESVSEVCSSACSGYFGFRGVYGGEPMNKDDEDGDERWRGEDEKYGWPSGCICTASTSAMVKSKVASGKMGVVWCLRSQNNRPYSTLPPPQNADSDESRARHAIQPVCQLQRTINSRNGLQRETVVGVWHACECREHSRRRC